MSTTCPHEPFMSRGNGCGGTAYNDHIRRVDAYARAAKESLAHKGSVCEHGAHKQIACQHGAYGQIAYKQGWHRRWSFARRALVKVVPAGTSPVGRLLQAKAMTACDVGSHFYVQ
ncbi:hypothetical protein GW17_00043899 [Ensete ventricosum]|nr:hypothetical protein GW17_00043899 [Ensete ventricosum]